MNGAKRRLERARRLEHSRHLWSVAGRINSMTRAEQELFWYFGYDTDTTLKIMASLALDGMPARWRRICWECDDGWGHNVGGKKLGHAPTMNGDEKHAPSRERVTRGRGR